MRAERPILFTGAMVRAILDGTKTQTRRVVTPQPKTVNPSARWLNCVSSTDRANVGTWTLSVLDPDGLRHTERGVERDITKLRCPHGEEGDRLWVRESFRLHTNFDGRSPAEVRARWNAADHGGDMPSVYYSADHSATGMLRDCDLRLAEHGSCHLLGRGRPSIHMPRWASRLTLEVTGVRVERLREITLADAVAEGCDSVTNPGSTVGGERDFRVLWDSINGPRGFGWDANPWVWVVEFRRLEAGDER